MENDKEQSLLSVDCSLFFYKIIKVNNVKKIERNQLYHFLKNDINYIDNNWLVVYTLNMLFVILMIYKY